MLYEMLSISVGSYGTVGGEEHGDNTYRNENRQQQYYELVTL